MIYSYIIQKLWQWIGIYWMMYDNKMAQNDDQ